MGVLVRRLTPAVLAVGCGAVSAAPATRATSLPGPPAAAVTTSGHEPPPPGALGEKRHDGAWVIARCESEYRQTESNWASYMPRAEATSPFAHCPHWRMAAADACDAPVQPSFMNPSQCMCDLCEKDADCGAGASCVAMPSTFCGPYEERVCVASTDACHPKNAASKCTTRCVTLFGKPRCVSKSDLAVCDR